MFLLNQRAQNICNSIGGSEMHYTIESHSFKYKVNKFTCILHRALCVTQSYTCMYIYLVTDFRANCQGAVEGGSWCRDAFRSDAISIITWN